MPHVVVLEDDQIVRELVVRILEMNGYTVEAFEDAAPALEEVCWENVDLVISDLIMPMPGDEAIRRLREKGVTVPIVLMSGHIEEHRVGGLDIQATVEKPFKLAELLQVVERVL